MPRIGRSGTARLGAETFPVDGRQHAGREWTRIPGATRQNGPRRVFRRRNLEALRVREGRADGRRGQK